MRDVVYQACKLILLCQLCEYLSNDRPYTVWPLSLFPDHFRVSLHTIRGFRAPASNVQDSCICQLAMLPENLRPAGA